MDAEQFIGMPTTPAHFEPEMITAMVAYLASPLSIATNGASVRVDGGVIRSIG